jgi:hypothetical protein
MWPRAVPDAMNVFYKWDGRWLVALVLVAYFGALFLGSKALHGQTTKAWNYLGVPALDPRFEDLLIVVEATTTLRSGGDPWKPIATDPEKRPYNYPRWWLYTDYLGLNAATMNGFGVGIAVVFFGATLFVLGRLTLEEGLWASLFVLSTSVMFGVERGNIDLVVFILLGVALSVRRFIPLSILVVVAAVFLKLFPVFTLLAYIPRPGRKTLPWLAAAIVISLLYFFLNREELHRIAATTPHQVFKSYGAAIPIMMLFQSYGAVTASMLHAADVLLLSVIALSMWLCLKSSSRPEKPQGERELFAFRFGGGIFLGTFGLGTSWDYRVIFLAFCLPLLFQLRKQAGSLRIWANVALALVLLYSNWDLYSEEAELRHIAIKEMMAWGLVSTLSGILAATIDFRSLVDQIVGRKEEAPHLRQPA